MNSSSWLLVFLTFVFVHSLEFPHLNEIKSKTAPDVQEEAVRNLIERILPNDYNKFHVQVDFSLGPKYRDTFQIVKLNEEQIKIIGTSGVAIATGLNHYLKYFCSSHISWNVQQITFPNTLPDVNLTVTSNDQFRYYENVCTTSYSFVWWDWPQWEKHIDWMALNSFNLVLAFNGQEAIWKRVYQKLNLTIDEINQHFAGPAFLSWSRMGNIRGWGGPLSDAWHERSLYLQRQILIRMRELGIIPVLPAFAGHVPRALKRLFPDSEMDKVVEWNDFNDTYCCPYLLDPNSPMFHNIGHLFLTELIAEFGTDHIYNCDTFNENRPTSSDLSYIKQMGQSIFAAITSVDPKAIWIMQNWLFVHDFFYWTQSRAEALLTSVPIVRADCSTEFFNNLGLTKGRMLVLDLQSEQFPQYKRLKNYFGQPYIWCMLHNFGGTIGFFGSISIINKNIFNARNEMNSTLVGTGITPEGIFQNYMVYELMNEMGWRKQSVDVNEWLKNYSTRRYGVENSNAVKYWQILGDSVYDFTGIARIRNKYAINRSPRLRINTWIWYDACDLLRAWPLLLNSSSVLEDSEGFRHDLVDGTRQVLQVLVDKWYRKFLTAFRKKTLNEFEKLSAEFLEMIASMDQILSSDKDFLLGSWLKMAKTAGENEEEERLFEYNARNQISLWGPRGEIMDYASKQWAGVVSHLYYPRWKLFIAMMRDSLEKGTSFNETDAQQRVFREVEEPFTFQRNIFPDQPQGESVRITKEIYEKNWMRVAFEECEASKSMPLRKKRLFNTFTQKIHNILGDNYYVHPDIILVRHNGVL